MIGSRSISTPSIRASVCQGGMWNLVARVVQGWVRGADRSCERHKRKASYAHSLSLSRLMMGGASSSLRSSAMRMNV